MNIESFKAQLIGGGARSNQFQVVIPIPGDAISSARLSFMCHTASLPGSDIEKIDVNYRGRKVPLAGERTFTDWEVTIYNDSDFLIHKAMMDWSNRINNFRDNTTSGARQSGTIINSGFLETDMYVIQLDRNNTPLKTYKFNDAWPTKIGPITLNWSDTGKIEEFSVTFAFLNYEESASILGTI